MRYFLLIITVFLMLAATPVVALDNEVELIIGFEEDLDFSTSEVVTRIPEISAVVVKVSEDQIESIKKLPGIRYIEENGYYETQANDPLFNDQWGLHNIEVVDGWDISKGCSSVIMAILDTGVDHEHEDLKGRVIEGKSFIGGDPIDRHGHGTHVAGIAGAVTNNDVGIAGVDKNARILPVKVLNDGGWGTYADIAQGIIWAADNDADVINMSLGGRLPSELVRDACRYAYNKGVVIVAAAGNSGRSGVTYPAAYSECIAVAAIDIDDERPSWSSFGPEVDIAAPGVSILSSIINDKYESYSGTSMSAPHVTGLVGLLLANQPDLTPAEVLGILRAGATDLGNELYFGAGKINAPNTLISEPDDEPEPSPDWGPYPCTSNIGEMYELGWRIAGSAHGPTFSVNAIFYWQHRDGWIQAWNRHIRVFLENPGSGEFKVNPEWQMIGAVDFTGNGSQDIFWTNGENIAVWYLHGFKVIGTERLQ